jgi:hypothetical protein
MTVYKFVDEHPDWDQQDVVDYFASRREGALKFTQSTLSRKLSPKVRADMEARVHSNPNALSSKRPRVVTRPDVDKAISIWQQDMERKGETVSGPMLMEKRQRFEDMFEVPDEERLKGQGWIASFKTACVWFLKLSEA